MLNADFPHQKWTGNPWTCNPCMCNPDWGIVYKFPVHVRLVYINTLLAAVHITSMTYRGKISHLSSHTVLGCFLLRYSGSHKYPMSKISPQNNLYSQCLFFVVGRMRVTGVLRKAWRHGDHTGSAETMLAAVPSPEHSGLNLLQFLTSFGQLCNGSYIITLTNVCRHGILGCRSVWSLMSLSWPICFINDNLSWGMGEFWTM